MKLYTEEQVNRLKYWKNNAEDDYLTTPISVLKYISELEKLTPIELPSDEEIEKESKYKSRYILPPPLLPNPVLNIVYIEGAKWMRDKIQGGNYELQD